MRKYDRIIASVLLITCILGLTYIAPAHAEEMPYVEFKTDTKRLEQLTEDSKYICWYALSGPNDQIRRRLDSETNKRDYNDRDRVIMASLCQAYLEGVSDAAETLRQGRINRT